MTDDAGNADPLGEQAAEIFAGQLAADRVPSIRAIRAIRAQLHVGQPRAQRLRDYLATGAAGRPERAYFAETRYEGWCLPVPLKRGEL